VKTLKPVLYGLAGLLVLIALGGMLGSTTTPSVDDSTDALVSRLSANDPLISPSSPR
jgi:hypothetical protein